MVVNCKIEDIAWEGVLVNAKNLNATTQNKMQRTYYIDYPIYRVVEFKNFGYQIWSFEVVHTSGAWRHQPPSLPIYIFVLVCVIVRVVFLSNDLLFGCILLFRWVGRIFLGVEMH